MDAETAAPTARSSAATTRARILAAANEEFYAQGIRATSADRLIEKVGITKVTFYRHFRTKSDLVVAYLTEQSAAEQQWIRSIRVESDPSATLRALAAGIGSASCRPGFRGCAFINAAAEFADPQDPVRMVVGFHRQWLLDTFGELVEEAGVEDVAKAAAQLMLLRDGAMVNGYLNEPTAIAATVAAAFSSVLATAVPAE